VPINWGRVAFCGVVDLALPKKWQSVQKKGQAETCPYPQKEAEIERCTKATTLAEKLEKERSLKSVLTKWNVGRYILSNSQGLSPSS